MNKRHYEHTLPNIRGSLSNTYLATKTVNVVLPTPPFWVEKATYKVSFFIVILNYCDTSLFHYVHTD